MPDHNTDNEALAAEFADMKRQLDNHEVTSQRRYRRAERRTGRRGTLTTGGPLPIPQEVAAAREGGVLAQYALLATRVRAAEEWMLDLTRTVVRASRHASGDRGYRKARLRLTHERPAAWGRTIHSAGARKLETPALANHQSGVSPLAAPRS